MFVADIHISWTEEDTHGLLTEEAFLLCNTDSQTVGNETKFNGYTLVPSGYTVVAYNMGINRKRLLMEGVVSIKATTHGVHKVCVIIKNF